MKKACFTFTLLILVLTVLSQKVNEVNLKWKINPEDTIIYKTVMSEIDTFDLDLNYSSDILKALSDSNKADGFLQDYINGINQIYQEIDFITLLTQSKKGIVDITMVSRPKDAGIAVEEEAVSNKKSFTELNAESFDDSSDLEYEETAEDVFEEEVYEVDTEVVEETVEEVIEEAVEVGDDDTESDIDLHDFKKALFSDSELNFDINAFTGALLGLMNENVMLRGSVYETGEIHSFWLRTNQKNLIALFFELPETPVKIGDTWKIDINLIQNDHHFICDSSYKENIVTLKDIKIVDKDTIAVLNYSIEEFVDGNFNMPSFFSKKKGPTRTIMKMSHHGIAEFSVTNGRWKSYECITELIATGVMNSSTIKRFALIEEKTKN